MPKTRPDERLVYLALRQELALVDSQIRVKKIRERIQKHEATSEIRALLQEHNIDTVSQTAKTLLEDGVYHSTLKAKLRFPEVFEVSPAQSADRSASELEAARQEADAFRTAEEESRKLAKDLPSVKWNAVKPTLYPVYLPLRTQVRLLVRAQSILEDLCYRYTDVHEPGILEIKRWDCAESIELHEWSKTFSSRHHSFSPEELVTINKIPEFWESIAQLRHTAVHRLRITAGRVEQLLLNAEALCRLLDGQESLTAITELRRALISVIDEMKRNKDCLESRMQENMKKLAAQRKEIERQEKAAINEMIRDDQDCQQQQGAILETILHLQAYSLLPQLADEQELTIQHDDDDMSSKNDEDCLACKISQFQP